MLWDVRAATILQDMRDCSSAESTAIDMRLTRRAVKVPRGEVSKAGLDCSTQRGGTVVAEHHELLLHSVLSAG
jgi:hypothetical protein